MKNFVEIKLGKLHNIRSISEVICGGSENYNKKKEQRRIYFYYPSPRTSTTHDEIGSRAVWKGGEEIFPIC